MAAGHNPMLKTDPAIERWALMRENVYQNFRFTPIKTRQVLVFLVGLPLLGGVLSWSTDQRWNWGGKLKGDSLATTSRLNRHVVQEQ